MRRLFVPRPLSGLQPLWRNCIFRQLSGSNEATRFKALVEQGDDVQVDQIFRESTKDNDQINLKNWQAMFEVLHRARHPLAQVYFNSLKTDWCNGSLTDKNVLSHCLNLELLQLKADKQYEKVHELADSFLSETKIPRTRRIYMTLIECCAAQHNRTLALQYFQQMQAEGVDPYEKTFQDLLAVLSELGSHQEVFEHFKLLDRYRVRPSTSLFNVIFANYSKRGMTDQIVEFFGEMDKYVVEPKASTFEILIDSFASKYRVASVQDLMHEVRERKMKPTVQMYCSLLSACGKLGPESPLLVQSFNRLADDGLTPTLAIYNCMITGFCRQGNIPCALVFFDALKYRKLEPDIITYRALLDGLAVTGHVKEMYAVYTELLQSGIPPDEKVYETVMRGFAIKGLEKEVMLFRSKLSNPGGLSSIRCLIVLACNQQNIPEMEKLYEQAKLVMKKGPSSDHNFKLMNDIFVHRIRAYAKDPHTQVNFFSELLRQLLSVLPRGTSPRILVYDELIRTYALRQAVNPMEECLQQLARKWPSKVHELLRDSTVELVKSATGHLQSLPPMVEAIRDSSRTH